MGYLKERWGEMGWGRRIILLIHPVLFLLSLVLHLTLGQQQVVSSRGCTEFVLLGLVVSAVCLVTLLFEDQLFRWNLSFQIQNPDRAEPSDWELFSRWASWVILTGVALLCFTLDPGLVLIS